MIEFIKNALENTISNEEIIDFFKKNEGKNISPKDLADVIKLIKSKETINLNLNNSIDICGTGGSGLDRINTSTIECIKLAKMGIKVAKHGNNASSGRFGSFDLLDSLNYKIPLTKEDIIKDYQEKNIAFLYAKNFYPFLKVFSNARKDYKYPTIFNLLGPLLCPANSDYQIIGCSFLDKMEVIIETCKILGRKNVLLIRGEDGLDEVTLTGKTKVYELRNGIIKDYFIKPEDFGFKKVDINQILEKDINKKIDIAKKIINNEKVGAYSDLVDINIKVALNFLQK